LPRQGTVVDIEATHFKASKGELFTVGFLSDKGFTIFQRLYSSETAFKRLITEEVPNFSEPWFAFNKECEKSQGHTDTGLYSLTLIAIEYLHETDVLGTTRTSSSFMI
jgi:hypothetical protein